MISASFIGATKPVVLSSEYWARATDELFEYVPISENLENCYDHGKQISRNRWVISNRIPEIR